MGPDDWLLQDELEKYEEKIYLERVLLNSYESAFCQKMRDQNWQVGQVKEEIRNDHAKLEDINNPNGFTYKSWIFLTSQRCFHLGNQMNRLKCNRRKKQHNLRSSKKNLKTIQKELAKKRENIQSYKKRVEESQAKLDEILSNQKQALLTNQRQIEMHQELQEAKLKFPVLLKEMDKYLDTQTRDIEGFKMVLNEASDILVNNKKGTEKEAVNTRCASAVHLLKESLDRNKLELLKENSFCKYTLKQLQQNRNERRNDTWDEGKVCGSVDILTDIAKVAAERILSSIEKPRQMGELGHSKFEDFTKELVSISKLCWGAKPSVHSFKNSRPKMNSSMRFQIAEEGSTEPNSWASATSGTSPKEPPGTPTSMYTTRSCFSLPSLHESFKWP